MRAGGIRDFRKTANPIAGLTGESGRRGVVVVSDIGFTLRKIFQGHAIQGIVGKPNRLILGIGLTAQIVIEIVGVIPHPHVRIDHGGLSR